MTTISLLNGDFEILFEDETVGTNAVVGLRTIRRTAGASSTVYTSNELYSAVADESDAFQAMGFRNAMLPVTPNAYTLENQYFMPRSSTEFLKEGTFTANWTYTSSPDTVGNGVVSVPYSIGMMETDFVSGDIGRQVVAANGDTGTLLDFEVDIDGQRLAWIRPDDSDPTTGDTFDGTGSLSVLADGGTGDVTQDVAGNNGFCRYTAIQVIGSVPEFTEVYCYQDRNKLTDSTGGFQWWVTDTNVSLGIISILFRTHLSAAGIAPTDGIADSDIEVFARRYTALYDNFRLNVGAGGFAALPLASSPDINNTTGYSTFTGSSGTGTFEVDEEIIEAVSGAQGVITAVSGTMAAPIIEYYLVGDVDIDFFDSGAQTVTGQTSGATCTSAAPSVNLGGPTDTAPGEGGNLTIAIGATTDDVDGDGTDEPYSITIDCQSNIVIAKVYERIKYVTRRGQDDTFWDTTPTSVPGESYRGLDLQAQISMANASFTQGDNVVITAKPSYESRVFSQNQTDTYVMLTDGQTSLQSVEDMDVLQDESMDTVTVSGSPESFTSPKQSPFGTFTGTQIFGARGVNYINFASGNEQSYIQTDDNGELRQPPNTISYVVTNTRAGDRILVARDTGTSGVIDKDQFGGMTVTSQGATSVTVAGSIDNEVPSSGFIRVVDDDRQEEHKYYYESRTTGASGVFTFINIPTGTTTGSTSTTLLVDSTATFVTDGVDVGMLVRNTTAMKTDHVWEVVSVDSETQLTVRELYGPLDATQDWDMGDSYEINRTIFAYTTDDNLFDLILDVEEDTGTDGSPGEELNQFVKEQMPATFGTVCNVRQGKVILPFTLNQVVGQTSVVVTVVRQPDTIAT